MTDHCKSELLAWYDKWHPVEGPKPKTVHLMLVYWEGSPANYLQALTALPPALGGWLAQYDLRVKAWDVRAVQLPGQPGEYARLSMVRKLEKMGEIEFNGQNAYYLWMKDGLVLRWGGTIGGDVFGQEGGQCGERLPGVSWAGEQVLYPLRYDKQHPSDTDVRGFKTANMVRGAAMHELGHNIGLLPCSTGHGGTCVMTGAWGWFPRCTLEEDGSVWQPEPPYWKRGSEIEAFSHYGFMQRTSV